MQLPSAASLGELSTSQEAIHPTVLPAITLPVRRGSGIRSNAVIQLLFAEVAKADVTFLSELEGEKNKNIWVSGRFSAARMEFSDFLCLPLLFHEVITITAPPEPLNAQVS